MAILGGVMMVACGVAFTVVASAMLRQMWRMRVATSGTVVDTEIGGEGEKLPVVIFTSAQGDRVQFTGFAAMGRFLGPRIGDTVPVRYNERAPNEARIDTYRSSFQGPVILLLFGVVLLAVFVWVVLSGS